MVVTSPLKKINATQCKLDVTYYNKPTMINL